MAVASSHAREEVDEAAVPHKPGAAGAAKKKKEKKRNEVPRTRRPREGQGKRLSDSHRVHVQLLTCGV